MQQLYFDNHHSAGLNGELDCQATNLASSTKTISSVQSWQKVCSLALGLDHILCSRRLETVHQTSYFHSHGMERHDHCLSSTQNKSLQLNEQSEYELDR